MVHVAGVTGLEPATSGLTGQRSNQLSYTPIWGIREERTANGILPAGLCIVHSRRRPDLGIPTASGALSPRVSSTRHSRNELRSESCPEGRSESCPEACADSGASR
jgi:hypothetical protein